MPRALYLPRVGAFSSSSGVLFTCFPNVTSAVTHATSCHAPGAPAAPRHGRLSCDRTREPPERVVAPVLLLYGVRDHVFRLANVCQLSPRGGSDEGLAPPPPAETLGPPPEKEPGQSLGPAGQDEADPREEASPVAPPHGAGAVLGLVALSSSLLQPALTAVGRGWAGERPLFQLHLLNTSRSGRGRSCRLLTATLSSVWEELTPQQQGTKQLSPGPPRSRDPDTVGSPHPV